MIISVIVDEIFQALHDICDLKAPDHDGSNVYFFKKTWPVIDKKVTNIKLFFFILPP